MDGSLPHPTQLVPGLLFFPVLPDLFGMSCPVFLMVIRMLVAPFLPAAVAVLAIGGIFPVPFPVITTLSLALTIGFRANLLLEPIGGGSEGLTTTTASAKQRDLLAGRAPSSCLVRLSPSIPGADFSIYSFWPIESYTASPQVGEKKTLLILEELLAQPAFCLYL